MTIAGYWPFRVQCRDKSGDYMQETGSDRDGDGNSDLDNEVNELIYDMMMKVSCIMFIIASSI